MEKFLTELLTTVGAPLIAALEAHTAALNRNSDNLDRVVAGQEAAMAKLESGNTGGTRGRRSAKAADAGSDPIVGKIADGATTQAAPDPEPAPDPVSVHPLLESPNRETAQTKNPKTGADETTPTANYRASDFSRDQVKNEFIGWLGETMDPAVRKDRADFVAAIGQHFGVKQPFHPTEGLKDDEQRKQTLFYLRRKREGLPVNFSQDYDFDIDPEDQVHGGAGDDEGDPLG